MMRLTKMKLASGAVALVFALLLGLGVVGLAQEGHRRGGPDGGGPRGGERGGPGGPRGGHIPFLRDLNLTDAQKAQIKQITTSFEESTKPLRQRMDASHEGEFAALTGEFNESAVRTAAQERANVQVELEVARARMASQIYALLTPEQKAQVAQRRQEFEQRRQEWEKKHAADAQNDEQ